MPTFLEVPAPTLPSQQALNLLASAERPDGGGDDWMAGFTFLAESCPDSQGFNPCTELTTGPPLGDTNLTFVVPVGYRVGFECSTMSGRVDMDRARRQADRIASYVVAQELWTGDLSKLDPYDLPNGGGVDQVNPHLEMVTDVLTASTDPMDAIATLEMAAGNALRGGPVFIHGPIDVIGRVGQNLERVGNELRSKTGAVVIADAGYPGTGPDGTGRGWMYATGPVTVRLGPITSDVDTSSTTDRPINLRRAIAERMFAVTFDPCALFAIQVTG